MTDPFLLPEEIANLTDKKRRPAQLRVLQAMKIEHKVRPNNSIAILRAHINKVFDGNADTAARKTKKTGEADFAAI